MRRPLADSDNGPMHHNDNAVAPAAVIEHEVPHDVRRPPRALPPGPAIRREAAAHREQLRRLASRQHGHFNLWQARECQVSGKALTRMARRGEIERARPAVYRVVGLPSSWVATVMADTLGIRGVAVATASTALRLHGVRNQALPYRREVLVAGTGRPLDYDPAVVVHRTRDLPATDITTVLGVPTTTGARTLVETAFGVERWLLVALTDQMICARVCTRQQVLARATALLPGRPRVQTLIDITKVGAERNFWSWLERKAGTLLRAAGLPAGRWNLTLPDAPDAGVVDTLLPQRLVLDWDGLAFHRGPDARQRDDQKQNALARAGYRHLRFTWQDVVCRPEYVVDLIQAMLA